MRLGIVAYVVPFISRSSRADRHGRRRDHDHDATASIGVVLLGIGCAGYHFRPLSWPGARGVARPRSYDAAVAVAAHGGGRSVRSLARGCACDVERRTRTIGAAPRDVAPSPTTHR